MQRRRFGLSVIASAVLLAGCVAPVGSNSVATEIAPPPVFDTTQAISTEPTMQTVAQQLPPVTIDDFDVVVPDEEVVETDLTEVEDVLSEEPGEEGESLSPGDEVEFEAIDSDQRLSTPVLESETVFQTIGISWAASEVPPEILVRARGLTGTWTEWFHAEPNPVIPEAASANQQPTRVGSHPVFVGDSDAVQISATGPDGNLLSTDDLQITLIGASAAVGAPVAVPVAQGEDAVAAVRPAAFHPTEASLAQHSTAAQQINTVQPTNATSINIIRRSAWGAAPAGGTWSSAPRFNLAVVHHTAGSTPATPAAAMQAVRGIQAWHQSAANGGWFDIGYHLLVDPFGNIYEGAAGSLERAVIAAHTGGFNTGALGIAMLGDYSTTAPSAAMVQGVGRAAAWRLSQDGVVPTGTTTVTATAAQSRWPAGTRVTVNTIAAHRDLSWTSCPGDAGFARMGAIRSAAAATMSQPAFGHLDALGDAGGGFVRVAGWAVDPAIPSTQVHVVADGRLAGVLNASAPRTDIQQLFGHLNSGFSGTVAVGTGARNVCVHAVRQPAGPHTLLGCRSVTITNRLPVGTFDGAVAGNGTAQIHGWAFDPDTAGPIDVHVFVNGRLERGFTANQPRPDVGAAFNRGANHGFNQVVNIPDGTSQICLFAIDSGLGVNPQFGCQNVTTRNRPPMGVLDVVTLAGTRVAVVQGWAFDPDVSSAATTIRVLVDGQLVTTSATGSVARPDVQAAFAGLQPNPRTGFSITLPVASGSRTVCVEALDAATSAPTRIGCRTLVVP